MIITGMKEFQSICKAKLKELNPKYKAIEALPTRRRDGNDFAYTMQNMELLKLKEAVKKYGDCEVLSIRDYDETKTTSVVLLVGGKNE